MDVLKHWLAALSAAACTCSLSACTPPLAEREHSVELMASAPTSAPGKGESLGFTPYAAPPTKPPTASLRGQPLKPSQVVWRLGGQLRTTNPTSEAQVVINEVSPKDWRTPVLVLDTATKPLRARLVTYRLPKPGALPSSDEGNAVDCEKRGQSCRIEVTGQRISLATGITMDPLTMATVTLEYPTLAADDARAGVRSYIVSWVLRSETPKSSSS